MQSRLQYGHVYLVPDRLRPFYLGRNFGLSRELSTTSWLLPFPADFAIDPNGTIALSYIVPEATRPDVCCRNADTAARTSVKPALSKRLSDGGTPLMFYVALAPASGPPNAL